MTNSFCLHCILANIRTNIRSCKLVISTFHQLNRLTRCCICHLKLRCNLISVIYIAKSGFRMIWIRIFYCNGTFIIQHNDRHIITSRQCSIVFALTCISNNNAFGRSHTTSFRRICHRIVRIFFQINYVSITVLICKF